MVNNKEIIVKAIAIARVSGSTQNAINAYVAQQNQIQAYADKNNIRIVKWLDYTGHISEDQIIDRISQENIGVVLVCNYERTSRDLYNAWTIKTELEKLGIKIISVPKDNSTSLEENFMENFGLLVAQYDNNLKSERVSRHMELRVRDGYSVSPVPYGYKKTGTKGLYELTPDGIALKYLLESLADGSTGVEDLRKDLSILYYKNPYKKLTKNQFAKIATNTYYAGLVSFKGWETAGRHTPLITLDRNEKIKELLEI